VTPCNGRIRSTALCLAALAGAALLAGCDTGDGKDLKDFDPADYPSPVPTTTIEPIETFGEFETFEELDDDLGATTEPFVVIAPWPEGGAIDVANTCDGADISPAVSWGAVPAGTVEIAIALVDDTATSDGQPFVHWVVGGLDPNEVAIVEGEIPPGAIQALNFFGDIGYGGPCPPPGDEPHQYRLTAFALAQQLEIENGAPAQQFLDVIATTAFASADVTGLFQR
jgi:Raf kinase inhibitor-like YbhB/YbcL family protein